MKGICHEWSRGRHFSPSMPGDRYLKLGSKSDHRAEISGNIVWYDALAPRPEVLRSFCSIYANICSGLSFLSRCKFPGLNYSIRPFRKIENRHFYNCLKSSHFAIIWSFWVTNLGSNSFYSIETQSGLFSEKF